MEEKKRKKKKGGGRGTSGEGRETAVSPPPPTPIFFVLLFLFFFIQVQFSAYCTRKEINIKIYTQIQPPSPRTTTQCENPFFFFWESRPGRGGGGGGLVDWLVAWLVDWEKGKRLNTRTCHDVHSNYSDIGSIPRHVPCAS